MKDLPQFSHAQILESYQEAYQEVLKNIWNQSPSRVKLARQVLSWVIFTLEPYNLTLPVLQQALSLQDADETVEQGLEPTDPWEYAPDSGGEHDSESYSMSSLDDDSSGASTMTRGDVVPKETLLSVCRGLITMDKDTKLIRLAHYTARDYFSNQNVLADLFPHAQSQLTRSCIASLMSTDADHPFDQYSRRHWGHHAQTVEMEFQKEIIDLVQDQERMMSSFQLIVNSLPYAWIESRQLAIHCLPPLHAAAYFGLELTAKHLMQRLGSKDIKTKDSRGWTAMKWAVIGGSETLARLLFQRESDLLSSDIAFFAVGTRSGPLKEQRLSFRCRDSAKVYFTDVYSLKNGLSFTNVLPRATRPNASDEVVRFLLTNIPDQNIDSKRPSDRRTLLSVVAENWQWDYVGILLKRGADVNLKDKQRRTPLLWALNCPRRKVQIQSIVTVDEAFVCIGDEFTDQNDNTITLQSAGDILDLDSVARISIADHQVSEETVEPFICKLIGNNLEATNEEGRTALSLACESRFHVVTEELVGRGANLSTRDNLGMTPLHYACCLPCFETVEIEMLVCSGKSKVRLGAGRLPQLYPRKHDNIAGSIGRSVELLLKSGAEADAQNRLGETPLSLAEADGLESYVRLLNPPKGGSLGQTGPTPDCIEGGDYAKLLLAMWHGKSRCHVKSLMLAGTSELATYCLSSIERLSLTDRASVVFYGKPWIGLGVTLDESRIEIRETSFIGGLSARSASQVISPDSPSARMVCGSGTSALDMQTESTMEGPRIFTNYAVNCGGSSGTR
ncbi:hypothetical protein CDV36_002268 [Fusarium kuroshium]|uniref:Uncharacterized protein n=1 Tax=Fusarium kuroshium TaxID=2010991 RepID=A0A3M2SKI3_9HYPO|nr:hypothetical protein CDV36_002268 [Fusarium kuroshium]